MTKQEEIREGIAQTIFKRFTKGSTPWNKCTQNHKDIFLRVADRVMEREHSQGVVIKVDKPFRIGEAVNDDGLVAVEPLI